MRMQIKEAMHLAKKKYKIPGKLAEYDDWRTADQIKRGYPER